MITRKKTFIITFSFLLFSCNSNRSSQNDVVLPQLEPRMVVIDTAQKGKNIHISNNTFDIDSNLIKLADLIKVRPSTNYNQHPNKILESLLDSSDIIYHYSAEKMAKYYSSPFTWSREINNITHPKCITFIEFLKSSSNVQGIIYLNGGQFVESWTFSSVAEAEEAMILQKNCESYSLFEKTMFFTKRCSNKIYIFHAQTMGLSYKSKRDFEIFKQELCL